jgi:hypothetical protein
VGTEIRCPYCAELIQPEAVKCKHCGEWLDPSKRPPVLQDASQTQKPNYSRFLLFNYRELDPKRFVYFRRIFAVDKDSALVQIRRSLPQGHTYDEERGLSEAVKGRFTCPNCGSPYTKAERDMGCGMAILVLLTLGLGLLLIPLIPFACECDACRYRWRS